ncbi:uncharacterized protein LOC134796508 [Cydia splendana]|uniref:uncharacterized protein LOC134796508 n=1 Tax=Cydia splendana TaxID=1100963 RepID=UPI00300D028C
MEHLGASRRIVTPRHRGAQDCIECFNNFCIFKEEFVVYKSDKIEINQNLKEFYEANIVMEDEKIIDLCCKTIEQSKCKEWYTARRLRISSSINVHHIKVRKTKSIDSLVQNMLFPKLIDCEATNYGKRNESHALEQYQKVYNCRVITVGVIVSKIQPWLCTSIDGVVIHHGCITKLVEFKCPISCQKKAIVDFVSKLCNVQYLEFVNGNIELKKKHSYYTQIQTQMYLTGMTICDLFVYSPVENGSCTVRVDRDEHFIKDAILKSEEFYFNHYLPRLYVSIGNEELNDKNNNNQILPKRSFTGKNIINL